MIIWLIGMSGAGKSAIGTRVEVKLSNGTVLNRWVNSGGSFGSSPLQLLFGVGNASSIDELTVYWPRSKPQVFKNVSLKSSWIIVEGKTDLTRIKNTSSQLN